jgi:hypothetical protein
LEENVIYDDAVFAAGIAFDVVPLTDLPSFRVLLLRFLT